MTRAQERRRHRARQKAAKKGKLPPSQFIELTSPINDRFEEFIKGNASRCERVVKAGSGRGKSLVICGAGPSLADHAHEHCAGADQVWGCNSALQWLVDNGHKVTHGFTIDQTLHMLSEWFDAPDVEYLVASSCHTSLTDYLLSKGRRISFFHNYVGLRHDPVEVDGTPMAYEDYLYSSLYSGTVGETVRVGSGLNSVTRAIDLAWYMGFESVKVLGADCSFQFSEPCPETPDGSPEHIRWLTECTTMHADGGHALASEATPVTLCGEIDGRHWETKPDLMISAVWLAKMAQALPNLELIGDTLPNALIGKDDAYLDTLPHLTGPDGLPHQFDINSHMAYLQP